MTPISAALAAATVGQPRNAGRLTIFPLLGSGAAPPAYLLLDDALAKGLAQVTEVSTSGSVPELRFENRSDQPILIVDGEALVGAKQNRIVNISILVPAQSQTPLPVSCVERGRWAYSRRDFGAADHVLYSHSRARKARDVTASLAATGHAVSDQRAMWNGIAAKASRLNVASSSEAMSAMFEHRERELRDFESRLSPTPNEAGGIFAIDGRIVGLEMFDSPETWQRFARKVFRSYGLDALDQGVSTRPDVVSITEWLDELISLPTAQFPSVGLGHDVRFNGERFSGGALVANDRVIHCMAFETHAWH